MSRSTSRSDLDPPGAAAACRCIQGVAAGEVSHAHSHEVDVCRRSLLTSTAVLLSTWIPAQANAESQGNSAATQNFAAEPEAAAGGSEIFETTDFYLRVPRHFQQAFEAPIPQEKLGRGQGQPLTPLKARFLSDVQGAQLTIVSRESFQIKPTFFQCQSITQLGSVEQLSQTVLPPGAKLLAASSAEFTRPDRDLSEFGGFVLQPRQTIYRYEFETEAGLHVTMAAAARVGKVFIAGGTAPISGWKDAGRDLQEAVGSFRLLQPVRNV